MDLEKTTASHPSAANIADRTISGACMLTMMKQSTPSTTNTAKNNPTPQTAFTSPDDFVNKLRISTAPIERSSGKPISPCSTIDAPRSPDVPNTPRPPTAPPNKPQVPDTPIVPQKLGKIVCKTCDHVLERASCCCGTYSVALCIRVENIPGKYRPHVPCSGSVRANFPSFAKANRYRIYLANQMSKKRKLRFLVNDVDMSEEPCHATTQSKRHRNADMEFSFPRKPPDHAGYASNFMGGLSHAPPVPNFPPSSMHFNQHPAVFGLRRHIPSMPQSENVFARGDMRMHDSVFQPTFY